MKNKFVYLVTIVLAVLYLAAGHYFAVQGLSFFKEKSPTDVVEARVVKLLPAAAGAKFEQIRFEAELLSGRQEGVKVTAAQNKAGSFAVGRDVAVGDKVLLLPGQSSQGEWSYAEHLRSNVLMWLFAVFALSIIAFGRMQGVNTFRSYVMAWYEGTLDTIFFADNQVPEIKSMICSVLAGYVWDLNNPYVKDHKTALQKLARLIVLRDTSNKPN